MNKIEELLPQDYYSDSLIGVQSDQVVHIWLVIDVKQQTNNNGYLASPRSDVVREVTTRCITF